MNLGEPRHEDKPDAYSGILACSTIYLLKIWGSSGTLLCDPLHTLGSLGRALGSTLGLQVQGC